MRAFALCCMLRSINDFRAAMTGSFGTAKDAASCLVSPLQLKLQLASEAVSAHQAGVVRAALCLLS